MKSIRGRLLAMLLVGLTLVLIGGGAGVHWIAARALTHQFDTGLISRAHTLAALVKLEPGGLVLETSDAPPTMLGETFFEIHVRNGRLLKRSGNLEEFALPGRDPGADEFVISDIALPGDAAGRAIWFRFHPRADPDDWQGRDISAARPAELVVVAALDRGSVDRALGAVLGALVIVGFVVGATMIVLVMVGVRWGLAPLDRLSAQIGGISGETISRRLEDPEAPRELVPISSQLNRLLDRVEEAIERERFFVDAAAHELRTPLAELRATVEVSLRWPDAARAQASLRQLLDIGRDMERLVEALLLISRAGADHFTPPAAMPMAPLVDHCLERGRDIIGAKRLKVELDVSESATMPASPDGLEIIVRNLVSNALHYTPPEGCVSIRAAGDNGTTTLIVENGPVTLAQRDLPRMFDPFWRSDQARSDREHVGLGLTVVQRVAAAIGVGVHAALVENKLQLKITPHPARPRPS